MKLIKIIYQFISDLASKQNILIFNNLFNYYSYYVIFHAILLADFFRLIKPARRRRTNPKLHSSDSQLVFKLSRTSEMFTYSNSVLFQKNIYTPLKTSSYRTLWETPGNEIYRVES